MRQPQGADVAEVRLPLLAEGALRPGDGGGGHHVDEAARQPVNLAHPVVARFGRDEHDDVQAVAQGGVAVVRYVFRQGQVGDDKPVDAAGLAVPAEGLEAIVQYRVEVAHQQQRYVHRAADVAQLAEEQPQGHAVAQCPCGGSLYDGSVRHGVAEGDSYLYHVHSRVLQRAEDVGRPVLRGAACAEVDGEYPFLLLLEKLVYSVHKLIIYLSGERRRRRAHR